MPTLFRPFLEPGVEKQYDALFFTDHSRGYLKLKCAEVAGISIYWMCNFTFDKESERLRRLLSPSRIEQDGATELEFFGGVHYDFSFRGTVRWKIVKAATTDWIHTLGYIGPRQDLIGLSAMVTSVDALRLRRK